MMPATVVGLIWQIVDIAICRFRFYGPVYSVVACTILAALYLSFGMLTILAYV